MRGVTALVLLFGVLKLKCCDSFFVLPDGNHLHNYRETKTSARAAATGPPQGGPPQGGPPQGGGGPPPQTAAQKILESAFEVGFRLLYLGDDSGIQDSSKNLRVFYGREHY